MFTLKIENSVQNVVMLTQNESNYQVYRIDGLNPPKAQINTNKVAGMDGSRFNSSSLDDRNLVIYIKLNGDVEKNRLYLYQFFPTKSLCTVYYQNDSRDVFIEGYVESVEVSPFSNSEVMQVSIICPSTYFKSMQEIVDDVSKALARFVFPFSINTNNPVVISTIDASKITNVYNDSETTCGVIIEVDFSGSVSSLQIKNTVTGEYITLNSSFVKGDKVIINTNKGEKSISRIRNGVTSNLFTSMQKGSTFFQLDIGDNSFSYIVNGSVTDDNDLIYIIFKHHTLYRGV